jgi:hypothetical protein
LDITLNSAERAAVVALVLPVVGVHQQLLQRRLQLGRGRAGQRRLRLLQQAAVPHDRPRRRRSSEWPSGGGGQQREEQC